MNCFIVSVVVVAIFALVARPPASNALEQVAYPLGVSLYIALPVALVALVISITVVIANLITDIVHMLIDPRVGQKS